jgi:CBS domain-containing protein
MAFDDDDTDRVAEEERPGADELQSALANDTLADIIRQPPLAVEVGTTLAEAINRMQTQHRGYIAVVNSGRIAGIFTERDVLMRIVGQPIDLERTTVESYMTPNPVTLPAAAGVAYALNLMVVEGFRHIPITDDAGHLVGVASMRNLTEYLSDFFSRDILNLQPDPRATYRTREGA